VQPLLVSFTPELASVGRMHMALSALPDIIEELPLLVGNDLAQLGRIAIAATFISQREGTWAPLSDATLRQRWYQGITHRRPLLRTGHMVWSLSGKLVAAASVIAGVDLGLGELETPPPHTTIIVPRRGNIILMFGSYDERVQWHHWGTWTIPARPMGPWGAGLAAFGDVADFHLALKIQEELGRRGLRPST